MYSHHDFIIATPGTVGVKILHTNTHVCKNYFPAGLSDLIDQRGEIWAGRDAVTEHGQYSGAFNFR